MPLQNRVDPFGALFSSAARGTLMGNRGGRLHDAERRLGARRWASRQWICCVPDFRGRRRAVWGEGYTELFFLDEPVALSAGHRPCFECRHADAVAFARAFDGATPHAAAAQMDRVLHAERLAGRDKRRHRLDATALPDGAFVAIGGDAYAVKGDRLLRFTPSGYCDGGLRPRGMLDVLTPPSILRALGSGYRPRWHQSAD